MTKSTVQQIRERFDQDVARFSNLETGQLSTIDAKRTLDLITEAARRIVPKAEHLLDVGCGAGNYTLMMLYKLPQLNCTLVDLSQPMLDKALERVAGQGVKSVDAVRGDIREILLPENHFDIILAGAVLHHLRDDEDWEYVFKKLYRSLKLGGCLMISDLVIQDVEGVNDYVWEQYGDYLQQIGGKEYRDKVMAYIAEEDSPRSLTYQLDLMRKVGFSQTEILHKNLCFAAFGGIK